MTHVTLPGMTYRGGDNLHVHFDAGMGGGGGGRRRGVKRKWNVSPDFVKKFTAPYRSVLKVFPHFALLKILRILPKVLLYIDNTLSILS